MRYKAIDYFRGLTIILMIIVNSPGNWNHVFPPLLHANWHGYTITDAVFPFFLYIVGAAIWLSFDKFKHQWSGATGLKIVKRTFLLFGIGILLNKFPFYLQGWDTLRIMGVLQRIALCYFIAAFAVVLLSKRMLVVFALAILLGYWWLLYAFDPSGLPYSLENNLVRHLDLQIIGAQHIWKGMGIPFDPEGLLSTLPAVVNVLIGWFCASILGDSMRQRTDAVRLLTILGLVLCAVAVLWHPYFPVNKKLWTSSFALFTSGAATLVLVCLVWALDIKQWQWGDRFVEVFGRNPLFAFVLSGVISRIFSMIIKWESNGVKYNLGSWLYERFFQYLGSQQLGSFLYALCFMLMCWSICKVLYDRKIYIKI